MSWYRNNARPLPWRETKNPYYIWLSEVILQQTTVSQGTPYYEKFVQAYPTIATLAKADLNDVLKLWEGLGYYSRARNLHAAANDIMNRFGGEFPSSYDDILSLKGIGPYSAAAIGSFAYGLPYVVVDGNVLRLISRFFGIKQSIDTSITKNKIKDLAQRMQDIADPAEFNQAIMEFGALCCTYKKPDCGHCVLRIECNAYQKNQVSQIPVRTKKIKKKKRLFHYHIIVDSAEKTLVEQRGPQDVWQGLFQFPMEEVTNANHESRLHDVLDIGNQKVKSTVYGPYKQHLTHQQITGFFHIHRISVRIKSKWVTHRRKMSVSELSQLAWPRIINQFLENEGQNLLEKGS